MGLRTSRTLLALAGISLLGGCGARAARSADDAAPLVSTLVVGGAAPATASYTGVVRARIESDLGFRVPGKIAARLVDPGSTVRRGQVLMRLDPTDLALAAASAVQRLRAAQADATRAAADEARLRDMVAAGAISASAYDAARAAQQMTAANLKAARSAAAQAADDARYASLSAESDGVVMDVLAQPGQVVAAGAPVVKLAKAGPREALVAIPEAALAALPKVATARVYGGDASVGARLREIAGAADPVTRTFAARYVLGGSGAGAPLGATVTVWVAADVPTGPEVPLGALYDAGGGPGVWVVGPDRVVSWRPVTVRAWRDEGAEIAPGAVRPGERIVALGAQLLRAGERVRLAAGATGARS